ncbi:biotin--[acetyl-CoA-carboxylase] ligase [Caldicellulosiruptoraceae bacterium PP1]
MINKDNITILKMLYNQNDYVSGEHIAEYFNISRMAVNKRIKDLKESFEIEAHTNKGYILKNRDIIRIWEIEDYIKNSSLFSEFIYLNEIDSTNLFIKNNISKLSNGTIVYTEKQVQGRGRLGRSWIDFSKGLKFSILINMKDTPLQKVIPLTLFTGLCMAKALLSFGIDAKIKWPNDIFLNNKKICGILTELTGEVDKTDFIVIGIGLNINGTNIPNELQNIATTIENATKRIYDRTSILIRFLKEFENNIDVFLTDGFIKFKEQYKSLCLNLNKNILINGEKELYCSDIGDNGELICDDNNKKVVIQSGEVSIRF